MKVLTLNIADGEQSNTPEAIGFAAPEELFRLLTAKRWEIVRALAGAGPMTIRSAARRLMRDVKAVHGDIHALLNAGVLHKTPDGRVELPFEAVRVDVTVRAH